MACHSSSDKLRNISFIHMFIGFLTVITGVVQHVEIRGLMSFFGFGLWGGVWFVITGLLGYFSSFKDRNTRNCNKCFIGTFMGFAIFGALIALFIVIISVISVMNFHGCLDCLTAGKKRCTMVFVSNPSRSRCIAGKYISYFLMVLQVIHFCLTLASLAMCCTICGQLRQAAQVVYMPASGGMAQVQGEVIIGGQPGQTQVVHPETFAAPPGSWQQPPRMATSTPSYI